jgi:hypothetical protein
MWSNFTYAAIPGIVYKSRLMGVDVAVKQIKSGYGQVNEFEHEVAMLRFVAATFCDQRRGFFGGPLHT